MSDELLLFEFFEQESASRNARKRKRLQLRSQFDPFNSFKDAEFISRYRLSKELVRNLCLELKPMFRDPVKSTDISLENKVLTALSFYATGSNQRPIGDLGGHSMAQQTVSSVLMQITNALNSPKMRKKYIVFPNTLEERNCIRKEFHEQFGIPGVLGCIDCTQVAIIRPKEHDERYFCRKQYHSLKVQLICDANMNITSVDASYGGASRDSVIWDQHPIKAHLEALKETTWLLGDSEYQLSQYMMTPIFDAKPDTPESHYTNIHFRTTNIVKRTIRLLKSRFRCLLANRVLHYKPEFAASIVNACVILHNICNKAKLPVPELSDEEIEQEAQMEDNYINFGNESQHDLQGTATRARLVDWLWAARED